MIEERVSAPLWQGYDTIEAWRKFVAHDFPHPSRPIAYETVKSCLKRGKRLSFCEIGFGSVYDFRVCFKKLHDEGMIAYTGVDYMQQFVDYAKIDYPEYTWKQGEFATLEPRSFDILYTRHTVQHQSPDTYEDCIRKFIGAARRYAIIVFHPPLDKEHHHFEYGGWCNTWDRDKVNTLIIDAGFSIKVIPADEDEIYLLSK